MSRYFIKRILLAILVMFLISAVVFFSLSLMPSNPARIILGRDAPEEAVQALMDEMGLNDPLIEQYVRYITGVLKGDFGMSYDGREPITSAINRTLPNTLIIALVTIVITVILGALLGIISAVKQYSLLDNIVVFSTTIISSIPQFLVATLLMLVFAVNLKILPPNGVDSWKGFVLPIATLAIGGIAACARMTRSIMLDILDSDYARTARAKGASEKTVIFKHVLKNALIPLVTTIGMMLSGLLGGAVVIERVFQIPGIGSLAVEGMNAQNAPMVMGCILLISCMSCIINLCVDLSYAMIDPRIKSEFSNR